MSRPPRIAITLGDPCGIGPELLLRSLPILGAWADVVVVGARAGVDLLKGTEGRLVNWRWADAPAPAPEGFLGTACGLEVENLGGSTTALWLDPTPEIHTGQLVLGRGSAASGRATVEAIRLAAGLALSGAADALTTLPMAKSAAHLAGYPIPGHTEYLQTLAGAPLTRMAFVSPRLSVVLHTVHQSLRSVVEDLDAEAVAETLAFSASRFIQLTGNPDLRVALCALNPHAGEAGAFGDEERLLAEARDRAEAAFREAGPAGPFASLPSPFPAEPAPAGWTLHPGEPPVPRPASGPRGPRFSGPLPSDSLFHRAVSGEFDLVVALYHDQGLIPIKLLEPSRAVNLTLGLPFIRTSPDHGTAFDKAGRWIADPRNFLEAAALAVRLAGRAQGEPWTARVAEP
ncbi:PdxA family dehydrogenase [Geothrix edaphica]|uniref:4-hydroxythreonine-4-phosphate dehydrogenase n=1 Tax=Geothrix edaphica TaxID=2927976 RepID=A0ABQ5PX46_9BACT|nr:4-hydroxythreonine-4-phosphate dehydrogenase PdxA [Geothrix edaphica]GLH66650.1 4-hydroxythreonine-4-phosphate dehydrogenase [Geothrix edaphica]